MTMKSIVKRFGIIALVAVIAFCMAACPTGGGASGGSKSTPTPTPTVPDSAGEYYGLEPPVITNNYRAVARAGQTATIQIPASLQSSSSINSRAAATTAKFKVLDTDIAKIVKGNELVDEIDNVTSCTIKGLKLGSATINVTVGSNTSTVLVAVTPAESFSILAGNDEITLGGTNNNKWYSGNKSFGGSIPNDFEQYKAEPTFQLAWKWRNATNAVGYVQPSVSAAGTTT